MTGFIHRIAARADIPIIAELMEVSINANFQHLLSAEEIAAAKEMMGVDKTLIDDGTYFLVYAQDQPDGPLIGCGGWSRRRTLYGGDHTGGRDDRLSNPRTEAARIRAMYTHPDWIRQGVGTYLLGLGEAAARAMGYKTIELGSTVSGLPLYEARGYRAYHREEQIGANGAIKTTIHMRKALD